MGDVLFWLCCLLMSGCVFMLIRNEWVAKQRGKIIDRTYRHKEALIKSGDYMGSMQVKGLHDLYISYDAMLYRVWVWDVEKMRKIPVHG